jgi:hypothetical protein
MSAFEGFKEIRVPVKSTLESVGDIEIYVKVKGTGPGLLLIHGYPQCHQYVSFPCFPCLDGIFSSAYCMAYAREGFMY